MLQLVKSKYRYVKREIHDTVNALRGIPVKGHGEFSRRIKYRHQTFWKRPDSEKIRNIIMSAEDPIEKWEDIEYWQRKLSNKHNAREFAKMHGCRVPQLYWRGRDLGAIDFASIPKQYVIRPTIGYSSKNVFVINNGLNLMNNTEYTPAEILLEMETVLKNNNLLEFLIEEFVKTEQGEYKIPINYKLHTFDGRIAGINVINRFGPNEGYMRAYDEHWNLINDIACDFPKGPYQDPPKCFKEIIQHTKVLSKAYKIYVRVDFFATDKGAVFNEFTPTPSVGDYFTRSADKLFTSYWDKYCKGMI